MKIYKKRVMGERIFSGDILFFGRVGNRKVRYKTFDIVRVNKLSLLRNVRGLSNYFSGNMVKVEMDKLNAVVKDIFLVEVLIGERLIAYERYCRYKDMGEVGVVRILRGWQR